MYVKLIERIENNFRTKRVEHKEVVQDEGEGMMFNKSA